MRKLLLVLPLITAACMPIGTNSGTTQQPAQESPAKTEQSKHLKGVSLGPDGNWVMSPKVREAMLVHANLMFLDVCLQNQPDLATMEKRLIAKYDTEQMNADDTAVGGKLLGVDQALDLLTIRQTTFQGWFAADKDLSSAHGSPIASPIVFGEITADEMPRNLTMCTVGVPGATPEELQDMIKQLLGDRKSFNHKSDLPEGGTTYWTTWNTSGSKSGVLQLSVTQTRDKGATTDSLNSLVMISLQK